MKKKVKGFNSISAILFKFDYKSYSYQDYAKCPGGFIKLYKDENKIIFYETFFIFFKKKLFELTNIEKLKLIAIKDLQPLLQNDGYQEVYQFGGDTHLNFFKSLEGEDKKNCIHIEGEGKGIVLFVREFVDPDRPQKVLNSIKDAIESEKAK